MGPACIVLKTTIVLPGRHIVQKDKRTGSWKISFSKCWSEHREKWPGSDALTPIVKSRGQQKNKSGGRSSSITSTCQPASHPTCQILDLILPYLFPFILFGEKGLLDAQNVIINRTVEEATKMCWNSKCPKGTFSPDCFVHNYFRILLLLYRYSLAGAQNILSA